MADFSMTTPCICGRRAVSWGQCANALCRRTAALRQGTKAGHCHPATVAEGQGAARDKIARHLDVERATGERAVVVVEAAEEASGLYGHGALSRCARNQRRIEAL